MYKTKQSRFSDGGCRELAALLTDAVTGRAQLVDSLAEQSGVTSQSVYRAARRGGWKSGRRKRSDAAAPRYTQKEILERYEQNIIGARNYRKRAALVLANMPRQAADVIMRRCVAYFPGNSARGFFSQQFLKHRALIEITDSVTRSPSAMLAMLHIMAYAFLSVRKLYSESLSEMRHSELTRAANRLARAWNNGSNTLDPTQLDSTPKNGPVHNMRTSV